MAYLSKNLSVLAYANGFTLWHYATADLAAEVDTAGYFNAAADMLRAGDKGARCPWTGCHTMVLPPAAARLRARAAHRGARQLWSHLHSSCT